jgi:hypothetical protein
MFIHWGILGVLKLLHLKRQNYPMNLTCEH